MWQSEMQGIQVELGSYVRLHECGCDESSCTDVAIDLASLEAIMLAVSIALTAYHENKTGNPELRLIPAEPRMKFCRMSNQTDSGIRRRTACSPIRPVELSDTSTRLRDLHLNVFPMTMCLFSETTGRT